MPSDARSSSAKLLRRTTFFLDESILSSDLADALRAAGATVELSVDHFPRGTPDPVWLAEIGGRRGWLVLTKDTRIRYRRLEQDALINSGARTFVFTGGSVAGEEMARILGSAALAMARRGVSVPAPFIYSVGRSGKLSRIR